MKAIKLLFVVVVLFCGICACASSRSVAPVTADASRAINAENCSYCLCSNGEGVSFSRCYPTLIDLLANGTEGDLQLYWGEEYYKK